MSPIPHLVSFFADSGGAPAAWTNGYSGRFDGLDDMMQGSAALLNFDSTDAWSVSLWARADTVGTYAYFLSKIDPGATSAGWAVGVYNDKPIMTFIHDLPTGWQLERGGTSPYTSTGAWHHYVYTYDGLELIGGMKMYVDGVECPAYINFATSIQSPCTSAGRLLVASEIIAKGSSFYSGYLDEVSVFNTELTSANVTTLFNLQSYVQGKAYDVAGFAGVQSYWQMGDQPGDSFAAGGTIFDAAGSNDLTCLNTVAGNKVTDNASKFTDYTSTTLDGIDDYIITLNPLIVDHNTAFSVSAWFNTTTMASSSIISKEENWGDFRGWNLMINRGGEMRLEMMSTVASSLDVYTPGSNYADGLWHHVLCTVDGTGTAAGVTMYVDGVSVALATLSDDLLGGTLLNTENLQLGARGSMLADMYFPGNLDEISIYSAELTSGDATALHNAGTPGDVSALASWASVHTWWRMGDGASDTSATPGTMSAGGTITDTLQCYNMADIDIIAFTPP